MTITIDHIQEAAKRIAPYIHHTPILTSTIINELTGANIFFKCENFQKVGAFKMRGACNAVFSLDEITAKQGVATHSSGNHAAALSAAAKLRGIHAYIVTPHTIISVKRDAIQHYGGLITYCEPTLASRESTLNKVLEKTGAIFIHPYDNEQVIAGQGTAALEVLQQCQKLDIVIAPVGGGGLLSGTSITIKSLAPHIEVIGAEPEMANDAYLSFHKKSFVPILNPQTICDGLRTSLGKCTLPIILENVSNILTASEKNITAAMKLIWERMKIIIEPSSAVPLAILLEHPDYFRKKNIAIILSGGNLNLDITFESLST